MSKGLPPISINPPLPEVRTCPEHMCRILTKERLWHRCMRGEFVLDPRSRKRTSTSPDFKGRVAVWQQEIYVKDRTFAPADPRHIVLEAYCARTADGTITGSGLIEPKEIVIRGTFHRRLEFNNPRCHLCETGDMIPLEERFITSRYKPSTPPLPFVKRLFSRGRYRGRYWSNIWNQRGIVRKTAPS